MTQETHCSYQYRSLSETAPAAVGPLPVAEPDYCPHPPLSSDYDRCLFHTAEGEYPPNTIAETFLEAVSKPDQVATFAGGRIGSIDLSGTVLETPDGEPIDLRGATIDGDLDLSNATIKVPLLLGNAAITGTLDARGTRFEGIVDLAGAKIGRQTLVSHAQFDDGIVANGLDAGFVDARNLTVDGPAVFDEASFSANARFARSAFHGELSCDRTEWRLLADFAMISVTDETSFADSTVGGEFRLTGASLEQDLTLSGIEIDSDVRCCHAVVSGELNAPQVTFAGKVDFDDFRHHGVIASFDQSTFEGYTSFSFATFANSLSFTDCTFKDEVWFTYGHFDGIIDFDSAQFEDLTHLRDATFGGDVVVRNACSTSQLFFHGSTIQGDVDAREATIDHFQFGAELAGDADFRSVQFDAQAVFRGTEFGGATRFDAASFAGEADFTDCQFLSNVSFDGTEFLVSPTFEDTRFVVEPDLDTADFSRTVEGDEGPLIVARLEELDNTGTTVPIDALSGDIVIPAQAARLLEPNITRTKALVTALKSIDRETWYGLFNHSIKLARTAAVEAEPVETNCRFVFGLAINDDAETPEALLEETELIAAYTITEIDSQIEFSHLDPGLDRFDHLVGVPGSDDALKSNVTVATHTEFRNAILRRLMGQIARYEHHEEKNTLQPDSLPAVIGISHLDAK
ncbi:pentapeptide repeat-containing protein [Halostagnicola kamekurae]|uniref:Pentapeptide repeat-containing protein n=1 Tax=Halostagnicola kamekurae TaxID=619731 RepID=A0A1I6V5Y7_9EURY|nr:pentapeptide repeat-containing protein [Halostagnicola kamekurae]SFT09050.1 Pentapeptide repeat-containing protein [Halostagnicola kamekurae]